MKGIEYVNTSLLPFTKSPSEDLRNGCDCSSCYSIHQIIKRKGSWPVGQSTLPQCFVRKAAVISVKAIIVRQYGTTGVLLSDWTAGILHRLHMHFRLGMI